VVFLLSWQEKRKTRMTEETLLALMGELESDRVERKASLPSTERLCEAICAFANDFPNSREPGYLLIGVHDDGQAAGLTVTDQMLLNLAGQRDNGSILPLPAMTVQKHSVLGGDIAVVEVFPSDLPPVRYKGRVYIRTGPRRSIANETEERILSEKAMIKRRTFDAQPCLEGKLSDLDVQAFRQSYLPQAVAPEVIEANHRSVEEQLASLRFYDLERDCPTHAGVLLFAKDSQYFLSGSYVQYVRFDGDTLGADILGQRRFTGNLMTMLPKLDDFVDLLIQDRPVPVSTLKEQTVQSYPRFSMREMLLNAIMHRDYAATGPVRFYAFAHYWEIQNPGGLYGEARPENFPRQNAYRNPVIAEALAQLGYVNRFSRGVIRAQEALAKAGYPPLAFTLDEPAYLNVKMYLTQT
jgi:ATP-dependent DNA helicase RecG